MTVEACMEFCGDKTYAGLEYGRECWCAASLNAQAEKLDDKECTTPCAGKGKEGQICGGRLMLTAYKRTSAAVRSISEGGLGWGWFGVVIAGAVLMATQ